MAEPKPKQTSPPVAGEVVNTEIEGETTGPFYLVSIDGDRATIQGKERREVSTSCLRKLPGG